MSESAMERFEGFEADLKLVKANISQQLDQVAELNGEERKAKIRQAEASIEEAKELLGNIRMEKASIPAASRGTINSRVRDYETDIDTFNRKLQTLTSDRATLFGSRYRDDPDVDEHLSQRQQLLSGTDRLTRSSGRLAEATRMATETESVGAGVLQDLASQRQIMEHTRGGLLQSETQVDKSIGTLRSMARRMATNRIVTIAIIAVLVILIVAVIVSKFR